MLISLKLMTPIPIKTEPEEEALSEESKVPDLHLDDFDCCAGCKIPFKGSKPTEETEDDGQPKRGQQPANETVGEGRKVKEFYSFNLITGELLHVTALQALLAVFELRLSKSAPGLNLQDANENLGFCQNCGTLISQLYKLHQEVAGLVQSGSVLSKLLEYEDLLTDCQETDFNNPKKRRRNIKAPSKVNGISMLEPMDQDGGTSWADGDDNMDTDWNNDFDAGHDDSASNENDEDENDDEEINVKPNVATKRNVGIKITSVGSAKTLICEDLSSEGEGSSRQRRSTSKKVDYAKVMQGPQIGDDDDDDDSNDDWRNDKKGKSKTSSVAKKKTTPVPQRGKGRGRPSKSPAKVVVPPKERNSPFKTPAGKASKEATCQICRKVFPSHYLVEHMNIAHNAIQGQPCLICGKFFENSYKAIKHLLTHVPEKAFGCSRCHDTFRTAEERNTHTSSHLDSDKKLECGKCPQSFTSLLLLNKHEAQKHRQTKSFLCSICAKLLTGKDEWIQHILSHGPFQCYYCREFLKPGEYKRHVQSVHMQSTRPKPSSNASAVIAEVTLD